MTIDIYLDKSGPSPGIPAVTVAGVIARTDDWIAFTEEWAGALRDFENLPFFHMADYESGYDRYTDWNERSVKQERLARLLTIIEKHVMAIFGASVGLGDCQAIHPSAPIEAAYTLTASHCFNMLPQFRYLQEHPGEEVHYIFEAGDRGHGKLQHIYNDIYDSPWRRAFNRLGGKLMQDMKRLPPLQAADIAAFEGWKQWAREHGGDNRKTRYPFKRLSERMTCEWATLKPMTVSELWAQTGVPPSDPAMLKAISFLVGRAPAARLTLPSWG